MTIEQKGPGGISNSYGQRATLKPTKIDQSGETHSVYGGFDNRGEYGLQKNLQGRRVEALFKPAGIASGGVAFNQTSGLSSSLFCTTVKAELETDADAVKLVAVNRAANAITGLKALVGVTETSDNSTSAKLGSPTINGTTYQALQGSTDVNGWRSVTWSGASSINLPAANLSQQVVLSDWAEKSTIPRSDGGSRPLAMWRSFVDGSVTNVGFIGTYSTLLQNPTSALRNRIIQNSAGFSDGVANPAIGMTAGANTLEVYPIYRFRVPVFSVWSVGDSISQNDALVADKTSTWVYRACLDLSTPDKPVVFANMAGSSQVSSTYLGVARKFLDSGVPAPSCIVIPPVSVNDGALNANLTEQTSSRIIEVIKLCADYSIPFVVFIPWLQNDTYIASQDIIRRASNDKVKAIAASYGIKFLEFPSLGNNQIPERWIPDLKFDNLHPNEKAIETVMAPALKEVLKSII